MQDVDGQPKPTTALVDLGYRGVKVEGLEILHLGKAKRLTPDQRQRLKRRQAVKPIIGHLKEDCGMRRNWLEGTIGDALHPLLCAAGYNLRWLAGSHPFGSEGLFCASIPHPTFLLPLECNESNFQSRLV